jgi:hypothetical protein
MKNLAMIIFNMKILIYFYINLINSRLFDLALRKILDGDSVISFFLVRREYYPKECNSRCIFG